jgi:hypothetical protein
MLRDEIEEIINSAITVDNNCNIIPKADQILSKVFEHLKSKGFGKMVQCPKSAIECTECEYEDRASEDCDWLQPIEREDLN